MATANSTTSAQPKFTWLFLATRHNDKAAPVTLRTVADTEEAARAGFPGWDLTFAAKIRTETPFNAEWIEEDDIIRWSVTGWDMKPALAEMAEMDKAARHG